jgi:hypothetical protein
MSDTFYDRERGLERKYGIEREHAFKIKAHRDRHFGRWVASQLGLTGAAADEYATKVFDAGFVHPGDEDFLNMIRSDLKTAEKSVDDKELYAQLHQAEDVAVQEVMGRKPRARPR